AATGFIDQNISASGGGFGTSISSISIDTQDNAQKAIKVIDTALTTINDTRANLGAINNRLDFTVSNLSSISEKTTSARSRIVDADFASETANLSRATVLQQAATAMLAQANQRPQNVLSLLR
ncbi:MAG: flagellin, partial [Proteobacteria bacterium]